MDLGLQDKVAIVTGGSEGIGKAAALGMAREGARVLIVSRRQDVLEQAAQDIWTATDGVVLAVTGDVTERDTVSRVVGTALERFGRVDILVNNAGKSLQMPFEALSDADWQGDFDLKLWGAVRFIQAVIPEMRKIGAGRIINVTALDGRTPEAGSMPGSIARAAAIAVTKGLSKDLAKDNILVSTVCIGLIKSGQTGRWYHRKKESEPSLTVDQFWAQLAEELEIPLGRVGEAQEAGDVITFLASERASYLTGIAVNIDGGSSAIV